MLTTLEVIFVFSTALVVYSYVVYPLVLPFLARVFGKKIAASFSFKPSVCVVIPAHNEETIIERKLRNVLSLDYPKDKLSVWVGSDQSTDRTNQIVTSFGDSRVHLWVAPTRGGKTEILNHLVPQIAADIVLLTDANTMHTSGSLGRLVANFADPAVGGVAGHVEHVAKSKQEALEETMYRSFETRQKKYESALHSTISAFGGFYAIRKDLFELIPKNAYSNDDVLIPMNIIRRGFRVVFEPSAVSSEDLAEDMQLEFKRRVRIGAGNFQAFFWLLDFLNPLKGWPAFCYVSHKVARWFSPFFIVLACLSCAGLAIETRHAAYCWGTAAVVVLLAAGLAYKVFRFRALRPLYYFISMNTALMLGFVRYLSGIPSAVWSPTER